MCSQKAPHHGDVHFALSHYINTFLWPCPFCVWTVGNMTDMCWRPLRRTSKALHFQFILHPHSPPPSQNLCQIAHALPGFIFPFFFFFVAREREKGSNAARLAQTRMQQKISINSWTSCLTSGVLVLLVCSTTPNSCSDGFCVLGKHTTKWAIAQAITNVPTSTGKTVRWRQMCLEL